MPLVKFICKSRMNILFCITKIYIMFALRFSLFPSLRMFVVFKVNFFVSKQKNWTCLILFSVHREHWMHTNIQWCQNQDIGTNFIFNEGQVSKKWNSLLLCKCSHSQRCSQKEKLRNQSLDDYERSLLSAETGAVSKKAQYWQEQSWQM